MIISGVSLDQMLENQNKMREESLRIMSHNIASVTQAIKKIVNSENKEEIIDLVEKSIEELDIVANIAQAVNIEYELGYSNQGYPVGTVLSQILTDKHYDSEEGSVLNQLWDNYISDLVEKLSDMEYQSATWHSSNCY